MMSHTLTLLSVEAEASFAPVLLQDKEQIGWTKYEPDQVNEICT